MKTKSDLPMVEELDSVPEPESLFLRMCGLPHCLFLDSALRNPVLGRYSFLTADPFEFCQVPADGSDALAWLAQRMSRWTSEPVPGLPPFQGGAAGLLSYDLAHSIERWPRPRFDEFQVPALAVGLYDVVLAWDHQQSRAWIVSQGWPETDCDARRQRALQRLEQIKRWLSEPVGRFRPDPPQSNDLVQASDLAPQFATSYANLTSDFSANGYRTAVRRAIDYIRAGDMFQVNLSQRLLAPAEDDSASLYLRLRERNPAPFAGYFDLGRFQIISASPERFLSVRQGHVEARPIKGTRPRTQRAEADLFAGDDLLQSEKDRAENVMIVDLLRNDISKVCGADSVQVAELCRLEVYQYVQHLVSVVRGELAVGKDPVDLLRASFPGGSITGAPKVRAMEIIAELSPTARGAYCGSLGYIGFDGSMDMSILIRTITSGRGWWQLPVGGGIVAQSDPQREYEETWHKATGLIKSLQ